MTDINFLAGLRCNEELGYDQELEFAIVGIFFNKKNGIGRFPRLRPLHFTHPEARVWFESAHELANTGRAVDVMEAWSLIKGKGLRREIDIARFTEILGTSLVDYAFSVKPETAETRLIRLWQKRETIKLGTDLATGSVGVEEMQVRVADIANEGADNGRENIGDVAVRVMAQAERALNARRNNEPLPDAMYSGIREMDVMGGFRAGDLVIIAGRPGMGKSTLARFMARMNSYHFPILFLTEEMTKEQVVSLMACSVSQIKQNAVRNMDLDDEQYGRYLKALGEVSKLDIELDYLDEIFSLVAKMRAWRMSNPDQSKPGAVFIDYIQQVRVDNNDLNRVQKIGFVSTLLKAVAKQLNLVLFPLAQLSRAVETRGGDKRPILSDLRDSGELEQDADVVMFLYRPEYYGFETDNDGNSTIGLVEAIFAKNRHGPPGTAHFYFDMAAGFRMDPTDYLATGEKKSLWIMPGSTSPKSINGAIEIKLPGDYEKDDFSDWRQPSEDDETPF